MINVNAVDSGAGGTNVSVSVSSTAPPTCQISQALDKNVTASLVTTVSTLAAIGPAAAAVKLGAGVVTTAQGKVASIGKFALSPKQLEDAGILKFGSATLINSLIQRGKTVQQAITSNLFAGIPGAQNLKSLLNNTTAQTNALITNLKKSQTSLSRAGVLTGKESPTAISGVILAGATVGVPATLSFINNQQHNNNIA